MIKKLKAFTIQMIVGANVATIIIMLAVGFSDLIDPVKLPVLSTAGLTFPIFALINFAFLVFWLIFKPKLALVPFLGFLVGFVPMRKYCPINAPSSPPADAIKVLSYNVWLFAGWEDDKDAKNPILEYIKRQDADIVCLQESNTNEVGKKKVAQALDPIYHYKDTAMRGQGDCITILSKFPILSKEHIAYNSRGNVSAAFKLMVNGEEVIVINNHLETTGLSHEDKARFQKMMKGNAKSDSMQSESRRIIRKLGQASARRAPQAEAVARYISLHSNLPIIVCGDFNDSPISYAHRTIGKNLTDCYIETGIGPGISYHHNSFYVRIDNILCSKDFEPFGCRVDRSIKTSDHYPIYVWLKKRPKPQKNA